MALLKCFQTHRERKFKSKVEFQALSVLHYELSGIDLVVPPLRLSVGILLYSKWKTLQQRNTISYIL